MLGGPISGIWKLQHKPSTRTPPSTSALHNSPAEPSSLLAVVALTLIHRLRPAWVAIGVTEAARTEGLNPERISRLCSRVHLAWLAALTTVVRRGRPPTEPSEDSEIGLLRALLAVATSLLKRVDLGRPALRPLLVGAWLRLRTEAPQLTQQRFCQAMALPARTLRSWLSAEPEPTKQDPKPTAPPPTASPGQGKRKPRSRGLRRPRFQFDLVIPDTQVGADTTDLSAFGVPLKLMAAQDIGGRDQDLFDSVLIDDHESAQQVIQVLSEALAGREGMQAITDQGKPYMAQATQQALDALGAEHAPQREGDPLGKATVERAFRTIKSIAAALFSITDRVAEAVPSLRHSELAKSTARVVITALTRAYQAGARAARSAVQQRSGLDEAALARVAERAREHARADDHSKRLLLTRINETYNFDKSNEKFIRTFRHYPLQVLHQAESSFRDQAHRDDIRSPSRYFAAIVRRLNDEYRAERIRREHVEQERAQSASQARQDAAIDRARSADPVAWLREALSALAIQWLPKEQQLLCGGEGVGLGWMRAALRRLLLVYGYPAIIDVARAVTDEFARGHLDRLGQQGLDAICSLLQRELRLLERQPPPSPANPRHSGCSPEPLAAILETVGRTPRPPPPNPLPT